jgi:hypothetical protein
MALRRQGDARIIVERLRWVLLGAGLLVLSGCNPRDRGPASPGMPPRLDAGYGIFFNDNGDDASLAYGRAQSDDVGLMLQCRKGSRRIEVSDTARTPARGAVSLTLASGKAVSSLKAQLTRDPESGQFLASAAAPSDTPALAAFRRSGRLSVTLMGQAQSLAAAPGEQASIDRFFAACERPPRR